jgi:hypothetical protein
MFFREWWSGLLRMRSQSCRGSRAFAAGDLRLAEAIRSGALVCHKPDHTMKCHKLDYILAALGVPLWENASLGNRCKLCAAIGSSELWGGQRS